MRTHMSDDDPFRRAFVVAAAAAGAAVATSAATQAQTDVEPRVLDGQPVSEPGPEKSAGPVRPGRGSSLSGKVAVVTGAARGIGRAIAVETAANGADVIALDIAGPISTASDAVPATTEEFNKTVRQVQAYGHRGEAVRADIRDIAALRHIADHVEREYGKIDVVVANAAIQGRKPLLDMQDSDWRDVIENNLNGTANTVRAFAPKMVARRNGRFILLSSCRESTGQRMQPAMPRRNGGSWG
jgi:hypothetical protein